MPKRRVIRACESIKREISTLIMNLEDPRIEWKFVNVIRVWLSNDFLVCKVFISSLNGEKERNKASKILNNAGGFIKSKLTSKLKMKFVPLLQFIPTNSIEYSFDIQKKINVLNL
ncbi:MAG: 30S ribosome-binding factor RbfA [Candidatus Improbicoccus pseudotrichonymphae]|uniref:Ribosome-binding factor A n=1 Tax=Candidatus Improbicoccus pseudotrichonymphae TaxID=3033792 RepID=A0AA48I1T2_9FIRM|nr:MAG: 30S ribosome-binding factor RbfA [Candidatus Improbicoccus pseudotrichonymphae]